MRRYDVLVIGSGNGAHIVSRALGAGLSVGWVDRGPFGGTCMNVGCVPSKMLTTVADRLMEIEESGCFGVDATVRSVDFSAVMQRMRAAVERRRAAFAERYRAQQGLGVYHGEARFVEERTVEILGERVSGEKVYVACGARPAIPPIDGLNDVEFLTNETLLELEERPASMLVIGGGYIGVEYAHFFSAVGVDVTIVERGDRLLAVEEAAISDALHEGLSERMTVLTGASVTSVRAQGDEFIAMCEERSGEGTTELRAQSLLIATGRRSNADTMEAENAGIELDESGFVLVNGQLQTSVRDVWAFGDAIGKGMFTHVANREVDVVWHNSMHEGSAVEMSYEAVPHAVFTWPQIASVGLTEQQARDEGKQPVTATVRYGDITKGEALVEQRGLAKAVVSAQTGEILGFHIIGPSAPVLIQEVVSVMARHGDASDVMGAMHAFPTLPELVAEATRKADVLR